MRSEGREEGASLAAFSCFSLRSTHFSLSANNPFPARVLDPRHRSAIMLGSPLSGDSHD